MEIEFIITPPAGFEAAAVDQVPLLAQAYARGAVRQGPSEAQGYWFKRFGVPRQQDWPAAAWRLEATAAGAHYWLCADPVHLRLNRDQLLLEAGAVDDLDEAQAQALLAELNAHFAADELLFQAITPCQWLLRVPRSLDLATTPPQAAAGRPAALTQPAGADAAWARRLANEAQMLLHQAPANQAREAARQAPVNSLWLWGGGNRVKPEKPGGPGTSGAAQAMGLVIASPAKHVREMANAAGCTVLDRAPDWTRAASQLTALGAHKALIDLTEIPQDANWAAILESDWLKPAQTAASAGKMRFWSTLLTATDEFTTRLYHRDLFHFLRRKSLAQYIDKRQN